MTDEDLMREAYNAHERAESAALKALHDSLTWASVDALACLCDPSLRWSSRSWLSETIIECASEVLDAKLERMVAA